MKTTIKAHGGAQIILNPTADGVRMNCLASVPGPNGNEIKAVAISLTPDQWGALMFGGEMALEVTQMQQLRSAL